MGFSHVKDEFLQNIERQYGDSYCISEEFVKNMNTIFYLADSCIEDEWADKKNVFIDGNTMTMFIEVVCVSIESNKDKREFIDLLSMCSCCGFKVDKEYNLLAWFKFDCCKLSKKDD